MQFCALKRRTRLLDQLIDGVVYDVLCDLIVRVILQCVKDSHCDIANDISIFLGIPSLLRQENERVHPIATGHRRVLLKRVYPNGNIAQRFPNVFRQLRFYC
jgi:hypothetical protein